MKMGFPANILTTILDLPAKTLIRIVCMCPGQASNQDIRLPGQGSYQDIRFSAENQVVGVPAKVEIRILGFPDKILIRY
jgi:hypothetical protein